MASLSVHCADCVEKLGEPYEQVHLWLDEFFATLGPQHRAIRHNAAGVERVREMWGDEAAEAAKLHIERDGENFQAGCGCPPNTSQLQGHSTLSLAVTAHDDHNPRQLATPNGSHSFTLAVYVVVNLNPVAYTTALVLAVIADSWTLAMVACRLAFPVIGTRGE